MPAQQVIDSLPWYRRPFVGPREPAQLLAAPFALTFYPVSFTVPVNKIAAVTRQSVGPLYLIFVPLLLGFAGRPRKLKTLLIAFGLLWVWWLYSMQLTRYLLPTLALLTPAVGYAVHRCSRTEGLLRLTAAFIISAWLVLALLFSWLPLYFALPSILGTISADEYLSASLEPYQAIQYLNRYTPPRAKVISYGEPWLFYLQRDYLWGDPSYHRMIIYDKMKEPDELLAAYSRLGITHVIINPT